MSQRGRAVALQRLAAASLHAAVLTAGWLVLAGLGRQHMALWASGLLPLAGWLAASAWLCSPARAGLARRATAFGPISLAALAGALWWLPQSPGPALTAMALAWAVLALATRQGMQAWAPGPQPAAMALGGLLGAGLGSGPLLQGAAPAWLPPALLVGGLLWLLVAGPAGRHSRAGSPPATRPLPARAGQPWRQQATAVAAGMAMVSMMATLPWMLEGCRADALPLWAALALHGLVMLLPPGVWRGRRTAGSGHIPAAALLLAGGAALWCLPGWQGLMLASLLQAAAWRQAGGVGAGPFRLGPGLWAAAGVVAIGLTLAQAGGQALWLLHSLLACAGAAALWPVGWRPLRATPAQHSHGHGHGH